MSLSLGLTSAAVTLVSFIGILWSASGPLSFMLDAREITIPGYMVWFAIAYASIGSLLVWAIGKPLAHQNFNQQRYEADETAYKDLAIRHYLELCMLPHLAEMLNEAGNWSQRLSPGKR